MKTIESLARLAYQEYRAQLESTSKGRYAAMEWENLHPTMQLARVASAKKLLLLYVQMSDEDAVAVAEEMFG